MRKYLYGIALLFCMAFANYSSGHEAPARQVEFSPKCCKVCKAGKACGDSCISKKYRCHKAKGCACNG
jgi:hypothetical protein